MALHDVPAFRIRKGDIIRHNNRRAVVVAVTPVAHYSRNRLRPLPEADRHGVKIAARYTAGGHLELSARNYETVRSYR